MYLLLAFGLFYYALCVDYKCQYGAVGWALRFRVSHYTYYFTASA